ncbi:hypothetical protein CC79DRAFT_1326440 [Sarocladium strictum]
MQTLWSRTGLSHRCACRACDQVLGAGRRATTKAPRRRGTFAEAFTALYSSFLATAAVVDAVRKEDRKAKVDQELEHVREQLTELRARRAVRELQRGVEDDRLESDRILPSDLNDSQNRALWEQWRRIYDSEDFLKDAWRANGTMDATLLLNQHHAEPFGATRLDATTILRAECTRIMRHIQAEEPEARFTSNLTSPEHFDYASTRWRAYIKGVLIMADKLCIERLKPRTNRKGFRKSRVPKVPRPNPNGVVGDRGLTRRALLLSGNAFTPPSTEEGEGLQNPVSALSLAWDAFEGPVPEYWLKEHPYPTQNTTRLNTEIDEVFRDADQPLDELLGKLCLTILRSPTLPDVHTLNLLIAGFTRKRYTVLASQAYQFFFSDNNSLRSTPASLALSLTTPAMFWDIAEFKRAGGALIGRDPTVGAKLERRLIRSVITHQPTSLWAMDHQRRGFAGRWINAYAPMDQAVREALISCMLHLREHVHAASFFLTCLQTGASLAAGVVFEVFNAIAKMPDARSAVRLIRGLSVRAGHFEALLDELPEDIRGCVCRRLQYLMHITNMESLNTDMARNELEDLGMRRRHLHNLISIMARQRYTNKQMNQGRDTIDMYKTGLITVMGTRPIAVKSRIRKEQPTSAQLMDVQNESVATHSNDGVVQSIYAQIQKTVQQEVEVQLRAQAQPMIAERVRAYFQAYLEGAKQGQEPVASHTSNHKIMEAPNASLGAMSEVFDSQRERDLRRQIESSVEAVMRTEVEQQVKEHMPPLDKMHAPDSWSHAEEPADDWEEKWTRNAQQAHHASSAS